MEFPQTLNITITLQDMEGDYRSIRDCPLARALNKHFKRNDASVGGCSANFVYDDVYTPEYQIQNWDYLTHQELKHNPKEGDIQHIVNLKLR